MLPSNHVTAETVHSHDTLILLSSVGATLPSELHTVSIFVINLWQHVMGNAENQVILKHRYKVPLRSIKINDKILFK